ncbi:DUF4249 domain-containing protein [Salinibacter altiplanensis]|uniref:DUF4249 domain-containing protein n=1 Tax=Salinibacter altiplanensis TaxID=1803181 RepID=UPI001F1A8B18|nr:DUF4249 domain-containing protein [Salinibacter altiplanensis]
MLRALGGGILLVGLVLMLGRCDLTEPTEPQSVVVEAFLKTGRPLPAIMLRRTRPLDVPGGRDENAAQGATVELRMDAQTVAYEEADSGRYVPGSNLEAFPAGVPWALTVRWRGEVARAEGRTPPPISLGEVCVEAPSSPVRAIRVDSLRRDSLDIPAEREYLYPVDVSVKWPVEASPSGVDTTHWVRPQLRPDTLESSSRVVNFFLEPVDVRREDRFRAQNGAGMWRGVYAVPVADSTSAFPSHDLTVTLARGDTAFAAFARSREDPGRREPISNVDGGLGIATAVALDSLRRTVASGEKRCYAP